MIENEGTRALRVVMDLTDRSSLAPGIDERTTTARPLPSVTDVVRRVADRFVPYADLKGIKMQVDVPDLDERFADHDRLAESLAILMDNALHYVPASGQVVMGLRWVEHKGKPLLLFLMVCVWAGA